MMGNNKFTVRRATPDDAESLAALAARTFRDTYEPLSDPADVEAYIAEAFTPAVMKAEVAHPGSSVLLGSTTGALVGYAILRRSCVPGCVRGAAPIELARLYLAREAMGKGYGSQLMCACFDEQQRLEGKTLWLGVWEHNPRACAFYARWGFTTVGNCEFTAGGTAYRDLVMVRDGLAGDRANA